MERSTVLSALTIVLIGFALGMRHATDPDHVVAVTTIVSKQQNIRQAALIGILWGLGHTLTIFAVGAAIILFKVTIPPRLGLAMELAVGLMLVLLGALSLTGILQRLAARFGSPHSSMVFDSAIPRSEASSTPNTNGGIAQSLGRFQVFRPLLVGIVHGLAGSAAVALLVLTTIGNPYAAIAYLLVFGAGTMAGMMLITATIALPFAYTGERFAGWNRGMGVLSGVVSLVFGVFLTYHIGFVDGLFTNHPHWRPK
jgi:high-affinity nickel-transport protein